MNRISQLFASIQRQMGGMSASQKLLIGSLAVIMVMTLFVVSQYSRGPSLMPLLSDASPAEQSKALTFLRTRGIPHETDESGAVLVEPSRVRGIIAQMSEEGQLPTDTTLMFNSMIERQTWTRTYQQNEQAETVALQNELSAVIQQMKGIRSARVIVDVPKARIGQPHRTPTANASVFSDGGLNQSTVDAIAHLVASARAGLTVDRVRVIDGTTNRQYRARDDEDFLASSYQEMQVKHEERTRGQIYDMLSGYIPGVVVTVRAQVDTTRRQAQSKRVFPEGDGTVVTVSREMTADLESQNTSTGGEAGARPNTQEDIFGLGNRGSTTMENETESEFDSEFGGETVTTVDPRGFATKINAVVNIPRPYFVELWKQRQAPAEDGGGAEDEGDGDPTDGDLAPIVSAEVERISGEVLALVDTSLVDGGEQGDVVVSMIPSMPDFGSIGGSGAGTASILGLPGGTMTAPELVRTVVLGGLAVISLGLVVFTAFRANRKDELPSAAELVGVPPELGNEDLVGEALNADSALAGLEVSEEEMEQRKRYEQIATMVEEHPTEAAMIIKRWMLQDTE